MDPRLSMDCPSSDDPFIDSSFAVEMATGSDCPSSPAVPARGPAASVWQQTIQSRLTVLGTLFLVTGAIGLPLLWCSPAFSWLEKALWSVMTMLYTAALIGVTWAIIVWCYRTAIVMIW